MITNWEAWESRIRRADAADAEALSMDLYRWHLAASPLYAAFCRLVGRMPDRVQRPEDIPFLPVSFFKTHDVRSGDWTPEWSFSSSGTTGQVVSKHPVRALDWYRETATRAFTHFYGHPREYAWYFLLPGYLERQGSSLVDMAHHFAGFSPRQEEVFFLHDLAGLDRQLRQRSDAAPPAVLLGVTHALLRFAEAFPGAWPSPVIVMETGGMKGQGPELVRDEVHRQLMTAWDLPAIHAEYGMTELFSQAYARASGRFFPGPAMQVTTRDIHDPFAFPGYGRVGLLCITDWANVATQTFIATQDLGRVYPDGSFEVLGRLDGSEIRGCNLMVSDALGRMSD